MNQTIRDILMKLTSIMTGVALLATLSTAQAQFAPSTGQPGVSKVDNTRTIIHNTWLRGGYFSEVNQDTFTEITIHTPGFIKFEWGTTIQDADQGLWRLMRKDTAQNYTQIASGIATNTAGGRFDVDLRPYLPASPPTSPSVYHVEVIARKQATTDNTTNTSLGQGGTKIGATSLGTWSNPVIITYVADTMPITQFYDVYRKATLVLDKIILVEDQYGPGQEEYFVAGFVQELLQNCDSGPCTFSRPGKQVSFAPSLSDINLTETCVTVNVRPYFRCLNPPSESEFGLNSYYYEQNRWDFHLGSEPNDWPRDYSVVISLMEQDNGDHMADWLDGMDFVSDQVKSGDVFNLHGLDDNDVVDYLKDNGFSEGDIASTVADILQGINTAANVSGAAIIGGTAVTIAINVGSAIIQDMDDDYYGTKTVSLLLPSNRVDKVQELSGHSEGVGAYRKYVLDSETMRFRGPPPANSASSFDGVVDITFHWEFSEIETF